MHGIKASFVEVQSGNKKKTSNKFMKKNVLQRSQKYYSIVQDCFFIFLGGFLAE